MQLARALASSPVEPAPLYLSEEPASSPRLRCPPPASEPSISYESSLEVSSAECPRFDVAVLDGDVLKLTLPAQWLPENRGFVSPHFVLGRLRNPTLELELYSVARRASRRRRRMSFVSVGVWSIGDYVLWRDERQLDFLVLDAVDQCLRKQLPPGGGVPTFKRLDVMASVAGGTERAAFSFRA